ncbi:pyridoxamine 5'-phosphate oxidase family protein [Paenibacillus sp. HJGM_3]|uniref:pyridoxamine 5'-phosphate oxidase family protein n=1 Tax=Paenibacillus sp. HJGM_3 TaxID=3379816 RepID=UPI00385BBB7D
MLNDDVFADRITTLEELEQFRSVIGTPSPLAMRKVRPSLDARSRSYIARSPFALIATADAQGRCDVSPRGDAPGFVHILDDRHLFLPERPGNRRLDSIRNLLTNSGIGLIFLIPGMEETLRVNGTACITRDPQLLELTAVNGRVPVMGIGVEVEEVFVHCAKAFKRSGLWQPSTWLPAEELPSAAEMLAAYAGGASVSEIEAQLQESYTKRLY